MDPALVDRSSLSLSLHTHTLPPLAHPLCSAVGLGSSGALYVGVNLEFARLPLYNSVHAEQFLLVNALHHGEREIRQLVVSAAPCGHCRQFYSELACAVGGRGGCGLGVEVRGSAAVMGACSGLA